MHLWDVRGKKWQLNVILICVSITTSKVGSLFLCLRTIFIFFLRTIGSYLQLIFLYDCWPFSQNFETTFISCLINKVTLVQYQRKFKIHIRKKISTIHPPKDATGTHLLYIVSPFLTKERTHTRTQKGVKYLLVLCQHSGAGGCTGLLSA